MHPAIERCAVRRAVLFIVLIVTVLVPFHGNAQAPRGTPTTTPGITNDIILDNDRVTVYLVTVAPGARQQMHDAQGASQGAARDQVFVQSTAGDLEFRFGDQKTRGHKGKTWFFSTATQRALANVGMEPIDVIVTVLKK